MRRLLLLAALSLSALSVPAEAWAGNRPALTQNTRQTSNKVRLTLLVVHATDTVTGVDPRLASLESSFRYFKYKGYKQLSSESADVATDGSNTFDIVGNRKVTVTLLSKDDNNVRVHVEVTGNNGKLLDTTVKVNRDGTFIVAGPKYQDGMLILPLRASY